MIAKYQCVDDPVIPRKRRSPEAGGENVQARPIEGKRRLTTKQHSDQGSHSPAGPSPRNIATVVNNHGYTDIGGQDPVTSFATSPTRTDDSADHHDLPPISLVDADARALVGDSALHAHSIAARDYLVEQIKSQNAVRPRDDLTAALQSLKAMARATSREQSTKAIQPQTKSHQSLYDLQLPPSDLVLQLLRQSQSSFTSISGLEANSRIEFADGCRS